jgi:hypothetical protein
MFCLEYLLLGVETLPSIKVGEKQVLEFDACFRILSKMIEFWLALV